MNMSPLNTASAEVLNYEDQLKQSRLMLAQHCLNTAAKRTALATSLSNEADRLIELAGVIIDAAERGERPRIRLNSDGQIAV